MKITASKLPLLARCQWWARPEVEATQAESSQWAERGHAIHAAIEAIIKGKEPCVEEEIAGDVDSWRAYYEKEIAEPAASEVAVSYNTTTGKAAIVGCADRQYPSDINLIFGTIDCATHARVIDWKTGLQRDLDPYAEHEQAWFYAMCWAKIHKLDEVTVEIVHINEGETSSYPTTLDAIDLGAFEAKLRELLAKVPTSRPVVGTHCSKMYCPCAGVCPAAREALVTMPDVAARVRLPVMGDVTLIESPEHAKQQIEALYAIKPFIAAAWEAIRQYVTEHGDIDLGDQIYGARTSSRETIDLTKEAIPLIPVEALKHKTSKAAIERALGAKPARELLDKLRAMGATKKSTSMVIDARKKR